MSTFFHSAAMTLLSRTLRSLLYKYLEEVDVEGVNLPSLYNTDGHSGWGVRLSNVKLREGAKLMDLPGHKRKRKTAAASAKTEKKTNIETTVEQESSTYEDPPGQTSLHTPANGDAAPLDVNEKTVAQVKEKPVIESSDANSVATQATAASSTSQTKAAPARSSSWFYWYSRREDVPKEEEAEEAGTDVKVSGDGPKAEADITEDRNAAVNITEDVDDKGVTEPSPAEEQENFVSEERHEHNDEDGADECEEENEELPMLFRLGKGGRIGTLDVRLVGNDIHVLVEDAFLTVEAVQLAPDHGEDKTDKDATAAPENPKKKKPDPEPKTVGDRVMKENFIARMFSMIPNLFLRDIRVRLIVRDDVVSDNDEEEATEYTVNDSVAELGIEFLSVTDGDDFLAHFRAAEDESSDDEDTVADEEKDRLAPLANAEDPYSQLEYLIKRIRTGRGPEGGITLRLVPAGECAFDGGLDDDPKPQWSRDAWKSRTEFHVLRLSGLDAEARIYLGTKKEIAIVNNVWYVEEYEDYTVDSYLFGGVDSIAPGPQPPLPPMNNQGNAMDDDGVPWTHLGATTYRVDSNGIQSSAVPSSFHRVARGLAPTICREDHLPCEYCAKCWASTPGTAREHTLDSSLPMGGLVLHVSMRDPLEINIDRPSLETIGLLLDLFKKKNPSEERASGDAAEQVLNESRTGLDASERTVASALSRSSSPPRPMDESSHRGLPRSSSQDSNRGRGLPRSSSQDSNRGSSSRILSQSSSRHLKGSETDLTEELSQAFDSEASDIGSSFPKYMQPEKIQVLGLHLSDLVVRIHVMRGDGTNDRSGSFCYWDIFAKCITMDHQKLSSHEKSFHDLRFDVGHLMALEHKGVERKQLFSLGVRQRVVDFDEITVETLMTRDGDNQRPPWPSTAAALLDLPPPLETLTYEARDRHALQMRYIAVTDPCDELNRTRAHANIRIGATSVDVPFNINAQIQAIIKEANESVFGSVKEENPPESADHAGAEVEGNEIPIDSIMKYKLRIDGGSIRLDPSVNVRLPLTSVVGEQSSSSGTMFETLLERVKLRYGQPAKRAISEEQRLSLKNLAELPENVRLRILLFLKDLKPLETALGIKTESNSFLRCRSVNKQIVRMAKKFDRYTASLRPSDNGSELTSRRQQLITELLKMDDDELEDLWDVHQRNRRKMAKRR